MVLFLHLGACCHLRFIVFNKTSFCVIFICNVNEITISTMCSRNMITVILYMKLPINEANNEHVEHTCMRPRICSRARRALLTPSIASRYCARVSVSTHEDDSLSSVPVVSRDDSEASAYWVRCDGVTRWLLAAASGIRVRLTPSPLTACVCIPAG